jgi:glyoxylase-like metal-dependent hydrolase (beta-lactamase superfamily II)
MKEIAPNVYWVGFKISNVYLVGEKSGPWVVVDTCIPGHFGPIREAAEEIYGPGAKPDAIILTHAHRDHFGSALALSTYWNIPIYAPELDLPYLKGKKLPPSDPTTDGILAFAARFLPTGGTDLGDYVQSLPGDGAVPGLPEWRWLATPGHTPGHVSLFRERDRVLIAGDAVLTVNMDKVSDVVTQTQELSRPPASVTYDWIMTRRSLEELAGLRPRVIASGHGVPMEGETLADDLAEFARDFTAPRYGRYVAEPARFDKDGVVFLPPAPPDYLAGVAAGVGIAAVIGLGFYAFSRRSGDDGSGKSYSVTAGPMLIEDLEG